MDKTHSTKNYTDNEGARTVIGGELLIEPGATVSGLAAKGVPDSKATTVEGLVADYNRLLAALRTAGLVEGRK
jgi:hypothetical protein